jgi:hypothetical protein
MPRAPIPANADVKSKAYCSVNSVLPIMQESAEVAVFSLDVISATALG